MNRVGFSLAIVGLVASGCLEMGWCQEPKIEFLGVTPDEPAAASSAQGGSSTGLGQPIGSSSSLVDTSVSARDPEELVRRAKELYRKYGPAIQKALAAPTLPPIQVKLTYDPGACPGSTAGNVVTLSYPWFCSHKDDGAIIHEFVHVLQGSARYDSDTKWLVEGIADCVRAAIEPKLTFQSTDFHPTFRPGGAKQGYQTTAHFLQWLGRKIRPGGVKALTIALRDPAYTHDTFRSHYGKSLEVLIQGYEKSFGGSRVKA